MHCSCAKGAGEIGPAIQHLKAFRRTRGARSFKGCLLIFRTSCGAISHESINTFTSKKFWVGTFYPARWGQSLTNFFRTTFSFLIYRTRTEWQFGISKELLLSEEGTLDDTFIVFVFELRSWYILILEIRFSSCSTNSFARVWFSLKFTSGIQQSIFSTGSAISFN